MLKNLGKKEKVELTITGIGVIFLIFLVIGNVGKLQAKKRLMAKASKTVASSMSEPIFFETVREEISEIKGGWGRDPFLLRTSSMVISGLEGLILNGIVWDNENPYAIINDDVMKIGDEIGTMTIVEITKNSVVFEQDGERQTLSLPAIF